MAKSYEMHCPVARTLDVIGERWAILVLRDLLLFKSRRFVDFARALPGIPPNHDDLVLERLSMFIDRLPRVVSGPYGDGYNVLVALAQRYGDRARPAFNRYVEDGAVQRGLTMCYVLREIRSEWSEELLSAFLADTRDVDGWTYAVDPDQDGPRRPIRICDEAAATIAASHPDLTFEMWGNHANLDLQIRSMQKALGHKQGG